MSNEEKNLDVSSIAPPPSSPPWIELPRDIMMDILQRLGTKEILENAQRVCSTWWKVCQDPTMWHVVDLINDYKNFEIPYVMDRICRMIVDRSHGQLRELSIENIGGNDLLNYIAERSSQLRHLRLVKLYNQIAGDLAAAAKNFSLLEELHLYFTIITKDDIEVVGRSCPLLKSFVLNVSSPYVVRPQFPDNDQALAIGRSMPELRKLALIANALTNEGLEAILDGCQHLELLDLRFCCHVNLVGDLGRRCYQQIVDVNYPGYYPVDSQVSHQRAFDDYYQSWFFDSDEDDGDYRDEYDNLDYREYESEFDDEIFWW